MSTVQQTLGGNSTRQDFIAGYANTTSAVDAIQFKICVRKHRLRDNRFIWGKLGFYNYMEIVYKQKTRRTTMPRFKMVNGERIQLTAEEEAARDAEEAAWEAGALGRAQAALKS